jgi:TetR/AcrR family transcriptional repressor of nem operon
MSRPREFDEAAALRNAMYTFWSKGFEATSVSDLTESMGVSRSTLYASFGDKEAVFDRVLDLYADEISAERYRLLRDAVSAREGLRAYFLHHIRFATDPQFPGGCLVVNTAVELKTLDDKVGAALAARSEKMEGSIRELLARGQQRGEISELKDIRALARLYAAFTYGLHVLARMGRGRKNLELSVDAALSALDER